MVYKWLNNIHFFLFPPTCMLCGAAGEAGRDLCNACHAALPRLTRPCPVCAKPLAGSEKLVCGECLKHPPPFEQTISAFRYTSPLAKLITDLKFNQRLAAARLLGDLLADELQANAPPMPECLIPVPLHPKRIRERGFNQSLEIARRVGKQLAIPVDADLCHRTRHTAPQTGLDAKARRQNIRHAFALRQPCRYKHIAIIDDVITTGHTVNETAALFRKQGVEQIRIWSVARAVID
ncbi:MAG: ComF family protein [Gammaproteobacteria bacterium]|nr:ComF family protein [Gammaproteobacteria bacterium]MDH5653222.1 ComF family protein [Gammaproteobacteria bacterium]